MRTALRIVGIGSILVTGGVAQAFTQVGVFGPDGSRIAYEKKGDTIIIREYQKLTIASEIKDPAGNTERLARPPIEMPEVVFKELVKLKLSSLDKRPLSPDQEKLLELYLTEIPNRAEENDNTSDFAEHLKRIETAHEKARGGIAFNLLREIAAISPCSDLAGKEHLVGAACITSQRVVFARVSEPEPGWRVAIPNGRAWFIGVKRQANHAEAKEFCSKPGRVLPFKEDYEAFASYFARGINGYFTAEGRKELFALFPNMVRRWFWTDTPYEDADPLHEDAENAWGFVGDFGVIGYSPLDVRGSSAARCMSAPAN